MNLTSAQLKVLRAAVVATAAAGALAISAPAMASSAHTAHIAKSSAAPRVFYW